MSNRFDPLARYGIKPSKKKEEPERQTIVHVPGGFNPRNYYDRSQIDAMFAGFTPSGGSGASGYGIANGPEYTDTYVYVGMLNETSGAWYIYRRTLSDNTRLYAQGSSNYATNWTNRASLSYS